MHRKWVTPILLFVTITSALAGTWQSTAQADYRESNLSIQLPTVDVPTVTSSPSGPMVTMKPSSETQANLRSGPGIFYEAVGILLMGQRLPARGRSPAGEWIQVDYPGAPGGKAWVYAALVDIVPPVILPIVELPPTPTPVVTATIDPTLAARFVVTSEPTRLPTFTAPPPLAIPTFTVNTGPSLGNVPMGFIILGLAALGVFFGIVAFSQSR